MFKFLWRCENDYFPRHSCHASVRHPCPCGTTVRFSHHIPGMVYWFGDIGGGFVGSLRFVMGFLCIILVRIRRVIVLGLALELYVLNVAVSEAFYTSLHVLEITAQARHFALVDSLVAGFAKV